MLSLEFDLCAASFDNSSQYQLHMLFCTPHASQFTVHISSLSYCMLVGVGHSANDLLKLEHCDCAMVRWICNMHPKDCISSDSLWEKLGINVIKLFWYNWLCWVRYVADSNGCINYITAQEVEGHCGGGRSRKTWRDTKNDDHKNWKLTREDLANNIEWGKKLRRNVGAV